MVSLHLTVPLPCSDTDPRLYCWKNSGEKRKQAYAEWAEFTALSASYKSETDREKQSVKMTLLGVIVCKEKVGNKAPNALK